MNLKPSSTQHCMLPSPPTVLQGNVALSFSSEILTWEHTATRGRRYLEKCEKISVERPHQVERPQRTAATRCMLFTQRRSWRNDGTPFNNFNQPDPPATKDHGEHHHNCHASGYVGNTGRSKAHPATLLTSMRSSTSAIAVSGAQVGIRGVVWTAQQMPCRPIALCSRRLHLEL